MGQFILSLRESLEALLVINIIWAYLKRTGRIKDIRYVKLGVFLSLVLGFFLSIAIYFIYGEIKKELFEGIASYIAVIVLTSMIYWMTYKGGRIKEEIESKTEKSINPIALLLLSFIVVFREVLETILFLIPFVGKDSLGTILGGGLGILGGFSISFLIYKLGMKINLRKFFFYTSILLIFIASGILGYGTSEFLEFFEEEGINLGFLSKTFYELKIPSDHILGNKGIIGSILAVFLGYSTKMEWGRAILQLGYLVVVLLILLKLQVLKEKTNHFMLK